MAYVTVVKSYTNACAKPATLTLNSNARVFFRSGVTTLNGQPYIDGTIVAVVQRSDGGYDVSFRYVTATIPPGFTVTFGTSISSGNVCDPDSLAECTWLWKTNQLIAGIDLNTLVDRLCSLVNNATHLSNATYYLPRIPFADGFHLTALKLSCHFYDSGTSATFTLRYRTPGNASTPDSSLPICATYAGNLSGQKAMTISVPIIPYDSELVLIISGTTQSVYANSTLGLTLDAIGYIIP